MITVNGETMPFEGEITVSEILKKKNFIFPLLIVKVDGEFVPRENYQSRKITDGAKVEVIHLISGG
jgi:sulfur carrier protein